MSVKGETVHIGGSVVDTKVYGNKIGTLNQTSSPTSSQPIPASNKQSKNATDDHLDAGQFEYSMDPNKKKIAIIFNHERYPKEEDCRVGTKHDVEKLTNLLTSLKFEIKLHEDLNEKEIGNFIERYSEKDYSNYNCIVFFVLAHGNKNENKNNDYVIEVKDGSYFVSDLWNKFTAENCPSLVAKPKLFFFNACRGIKKEKSVAVSMSGMKTDSFSSDTKQFFTIPNHADILLAFSTIDDHLGFRHEAEGTWYIQSFCDALEKYHNSKDLGRILTITARQVALKHGPMDEKQIPYTQSMLTKDVYFRSK